MPLKESEAIVLRTYPLRESDLLVTLFTRAEGKIRGVARAAMKSKRRFGGALEPLTFVRAFYEVRERQELSRLDACEVLDSPLAAPVGYARAVALAHVAELLDELLADHDPNDAVFRLALSVLGQMRSERIWMPVTYFDLWMTRLMGYLPDLSHCHVCGRDLNGSRAYFHILADGLTCVDDKRLASSEISSERIWMPVTYFDLWMTRLMGYLPDLSHCHVCGRDLNGSRAYFHILADGLTCVDDKRLASSEISSESRMLAGHMFRAPVESFAEFAWPRELAADLRKLLMQILQRHIEKKLVTASMLEKTQF